MWLKKKKKNIVLAVKMAQKIKALANKPDGLSSITETHIVEECPLTSTHVLWHTHIRAYIIDKCKAF